MIRIVFVEEFIAWGSLYVHIEIIMSSFRCELLYEGLFICSKFHSFERLLVGFMKWLKKGEEIPHFFWNNSLQELELTK
jgi:hypothetical protein